MNLIEWESMKMANKYKADAIFDAWRDFLKKTNPDDGIQFISKLSAYMVPSTRDEFFNVPDSDFVKIKESRGFDLLNHAIRLYRGFNGITKEYIDRAERALKILAGFNDTKEGNTATATTTDPIATTQGTTSNGTNTKGSTTSNGGTSSNGGTTSKASFTFSSEGTTSTGGFKPSGTFCVPALYHLACLRRIHYNDYNMELQCLTSACTAAKSIQVDVENLDQSANTNSEVFFAYAVALNNSIRRNKLVGFEKYKKEQEIKDALQRAKGGSSLFDVWDESF